MGIEDVRQQYASFPQQVKSLMLSTVDTNGLPHASYSPFVMDQDHNFFLFVSGLSAHTKNLYQVPRAAIMLIQDESDSEEIFARNRLMYDCSVQLIPAESEQRTSVIQSFSGRFGELIDTLKQLPDFALFQLTPYAGRFVVGFGSAFEIDFDNDRRLKLTRG